MRGSQEPNIKTEPPRVSTDGHDAAMLMETYGNQLDPWQALVIDCWLGLDEGGEYTVRTARTSSLRQENSSGWSSTARRSFTRHTR